MDNVACKISRISHRFLSLILSITLATALVPTTALAAQESSTQAISYVNDETSITNSQPNQKGSFAYESFICTLNDNGEAEITSYKCEEGTVTELDIPSVINGYTVTSIGDAAFRGCSGLTSVELPSSVASVGPAAFRDCASLSRVSLGSVESLGKGAFAGCGSLESVVVPATVSSCPGSWAYASGGPFEGSGLKAASVADGASALAPDLFNGAAVLSAVDLPASLESVGAAAFQGCASLAELILTEKISFIGRDAFYGDDELTIVCPSSSYAMYYATMNHIKTRPANNSESFFESASVVGKSTLSGADYINISYTVSNSISSKLTVESLVASISGNASVVSVKDCDGNEITDYHYSHDTLTIPTANSTGRFTICLIPKDDSAYSISSLLTARNLEKDSVQAFVGTIASDSVHRLTLSARAIRNNTYVEVYGKALANKIVTILIDGLQVAETESSKTSHYWTIAPLPNQTGSHIITAITQNSFNENVISTYTIDLDNNDEVGIASFELMYRGKTYNLVQPGGFYYTYVDPYYHSDAPTMAFRSSFNKPEEVALCWITSSNPSGMQDCIPAYRNQNTGDYIASGYFDSAVNGTPGNFGVNFITKEELDDAICSLNEKQFESYLQNELKTNCETAALFSNRKALAQDYSRLSSADAEAIASIWEKNYFDESSTVDYYLEQEQSTMTDFILDWVGESEINNKPGKNVFNIVHKVSGVYTTARDLNNDIETAATEVLGEERAKQLSMSDRMKVAESIQKNHTLFLVANTAIEATNYISSITKIPGIDIPAMALALELRLTCTVAYWSISEINNVMKDMQDCLSQTFAASSPKFASPNNGIGLHDPSGIVYEGVASNTLEGVTATVFYKNSDSETPIEWDAEAYDQINPQLTNQSGEFSWDVPKGCWQVKLTKSGYEDAYSEWLEVPPERTGLSIPMVSTSSPSVSKVYACANSVRIEFTQYMKADSLKRSIVVSANDEIINGHFQTYNEENGLSKAIIFQFDQPINAKECKITINEAAAYNGHYLQHYETTENLYEAIPEAILSDDNFDLTLGAERDIEFRISPSNTLPELKVTAESDNESVITLIDNSAVAKNGIVRFRVKGNLPGNAKLRVSISESSMSSQFRINVLNCAETEAPRPTASISRLAGNEAADTSAKIAQAAFPEGSEWVVIARDDDFADAMSATGLAGALEAPIILTDRNGLSDAAADAVKALGAEKAYIIGGKGAIPGNLESELEAIGCQVIDRIFGNESWDTSAACAKMIAEHGGNPNGDAIVAMSSNFQDALSISSFAYKYKVPIFLETNGNERELPSAAREAIENQKGTIYVPGGQGAVPRISVEDVFGADRVVRIFGEDGYDTSNQIATYMVNNNLLSANTVCIASGAPAPKGVDALAGAALAGKAGGVMLLANDNPAFGEVDSTAVDGSDSQGTPAFLTSHAPDVGQAYLLGGNAVIGADLQRKVTELLGRQA